jgi:hypothetical protein
MRRERTVCRIAPYICCIAHSGPAPCRSEYLMSNTKDRVLTHVSPVPAPVAPGYKEAMARLPPVQITKRRLTAERDLPAVGSFS